MASDVASCTHVEDGSVDSRPQLESSFHTAESSLRPRLRAAEEKLAELTFKLDVEEANSRAEVAKHEIFTATLEKENQLLKERVVDSVMRERQICRLETASKGLRLSMYRRHTYMEKLEAMERQAMRCHDDYFYTARFDSLSAPLHEVVLVLFTFAGLSELQSVLPDVANTVLSIYDTVLHRVSRIYSGYRVTELGQFACYSFSSAERAAHFALDVQSCLLRQPWPDHALACEGLRRISSIEDEQADALFGGPRVQGVIFVCDPDIIEDPQTASVNYADCAITDSAEVLTRLVHPGETLGSAEWMLKLVQEKISGNTRNCDCSADPLARFNNVVDVEPFEAPSPYLSECQSSVWNPSQASLDQLSGFGVVAATKYSLLPKKLATRRSLYASLKKDKNRQVVRKDIPEVSLDVPRPDPVMRLVLNHLHAQNGRLPTALSLRGDITAFLVRPLNPSVSCFEGAPAGWGAVGSSVALPGKGYDESAPSAVQYALQMCRLLPKSLGHPLLACQNPSAHPTGLNINEELTQMLSLPTSSRKLQSSLGVSESNVEDRGASKYAVWSEGLPPEAQKAIYSLLRDIQWQCSATLLYYSTSAFAQRVNRRLEGQLLAKEDRFNRQRSILNASCETQLFFICLSIIDWSGIKYLSSKKNLIAGPPRAIDSDVVIGLYRTATFDLAAECGGAVIRDSGEDALIFAFTTPEESLTFCTQWFNKLLKVSSWPIEPRDGYLGLQSLAVPQSGDGEGRRRLLFAGPRGARMGVVFGRPSAVLRRSDPCGEVNFIHGDNSNGEIDFLGSILDEVVALNSFARPGEALVSGVTIAEWSRACSIHTSQDYSVMCCGEMFLCVGSPHVNSIFSVLPANLTGRQALWRRLIVEVAEGGTVLLASTAHRTSKLQGRKGHTTASSRPQSGMGDPSRSQIKSALREVDRVRLTAALGVQRGPGSPFVIAVLIMYELLRNGCKFSQIKAKDTTQEDQPGETKSSRDSVIENIKACTAAERKLVVSHPVIRTSLRMFVERYRQMEISFMQLEDEKSQMLGAVPPITRPVGPQDITAEETPIESILLPAEQDSNDFTLNTNSSNPPYRTVTAVKEICEAAFFLYVDVEGSRRLLETVPEAFLRMLQHYNSVVLQQVRLYRGYVVKHKPEEGFLIAFPCPSLSAPTPGSVIGSLSNTFYPAETCAARNALAAAIGIQIELLYNVLYPPEILRSEVCLRVRDPVSGATILQGLRARCGIALGTHLQARHFCDIVENGNLAGRTDFMGPAVQTAAFLGKSAPGGDVWVCPATVELLTKHRRTPEGLFNDIFNKSKSGSHSSHTSGSCWSTVISELGVVTRPIIAADFTLLGYSCLPSSLAARATFLSTNVEHNPPLCAGGLIFPSEAGTPPKSRSDFMRVIFSAAIEKNPNGSPEWWWNQPQLCGVQPNVAPLRSRAEPLRNTGGGGFVGSRGGELQGQANEGQNEPSFSQNSVVPLNPFVKFVDLLLSRGSSIASVIDSSASPVPSRLSLSKVVSHVYSLMLTQLRSTSSVLDYQNSIQNEEFRKQIHSRRTSFHTSVSSVPYSQRRQSGVRGSVSGTESLLRKSAVFGSFAFKSPVSAISDESEPAPPLGPSPYKLIKDVISVLEGVRPLDVLSQQTPNTSLDETSQVQIQILSSAILKLVSDCSLSGNTGQGHQSSPDRSPDTQQGIRFPSTKAGHKAVKLVDTRGHIFRGSEQTCEENAVKTPRLPPQGIKRKESVRQRKR